MAERGSQYEGTPPPMPPAGSGERRVALVIGNGRYSHAAPLANPTNDAEAVSLVLARLGFDVVKGIDLDLRAMGDVQEAFEARLRLRPDVALLFYAGHGLQVKGRNYLVPVDAQIEAQAHLATRAVLFNDLLEPMAESAGASLIMLDACRDNPFTRNLARTLGDTARDVGVRGGLARIEKVAGTFIAYATAPDTVAFDGRGANSPFTGALIKHIETPGLSVADMMIDVRNSVLEETGGRQEPWDQSSLRSRFYFVPKAEAPPPARNAAAEEWMAIQHTTSLAVLARFRDRFPEPPWSEYADIRASEIRAEDEARRQAFEAEQRLREAKEAEALLQREGAQVAAPRAPRAPPPEPTWPASRPAVSVRARPSPPLLHGAIAFGVAAVIAIGTALAVWQPWQLTDAPPVREKDQAAPLPKAATPAVEPRLVDLAKPIASPKPGPVATPACRGVWVDVVDTGRRCLDPADQKNREFEECVGSSSGFLGQGPISGRTCGPRMVALPKGTYKRGAEDGGADEKPVRDVTIGYHLAIGKYEVTFAEWDACVDDGGCKHKPATDWGRGQQPVMRVSWDDIANEYLLWLNRKIGLSGASAYRMPTETEWEFAARAGTTTKYFWGNDFNNARANNGSQTEAVGKYGANPFGLYDMHGNVEEWVADCRVYNKQNQITVWGTSVDLPNRSEAEVQDCLFRGVRGGSWVSAPDKLSSTHKDSKQRGYRSGSLGFRLARTLSP